MAYVMMDCKATGAATVSLGGKAQPARKVRKCEGACGVIAVVLVEESEWSSLAAGANLH